jgi:hypothetical protein
VIHAPNAGLEALNACRSAWVGEISQYSQTYVNEQVTATASNESGSRWWKDDGNKNQKDVRGFDHTGGTQVRGYADAVSNWG